MTTAADKGTCFLHVFFGKYVWIKTFMFKGFSAALGFTVLSVSITRE